MDFKDFIPDPRTSDWPLMSSVWMPLGVLLLYFLIISWLTGAELHEFQGWLTIYFVLVSVFNGGLTVFLVYWEVEAGYGLGSLTCQPVGSKGDPDLMLAIGLYAFFLSKVLELPDSFFLLLRNRGTQVTLEHMWHHSTMVMVAWFGVKFVPGGSSVVTATISTFYHFLLFTTRAAHMAQLYNPELQIQRYSRHLLTFTRISLVVQFLLVIFHCVGGYFIDCGYPLPAFACLLFQVFTYLVLFFVYL